VFWGEIKWKQGKERQREWENEKRIGPFVWREKQVKHAYRCVRYLDSFHESWGDSRVNLWPQGVGFTARKVDGGVRRIPCQTYMRRVMSRRKKKIFFFGLVSTTALLYWVCRNTLELWVVGPTNPPVAYKRRGLSRHYFADTQRCLLWCWTRLVCWLLREIWGLFPG
jgi:hypothetical protein